MAPSLSAKSKNFKRVFTSPKRPTPLMSFKAGDSVEISSKEDGFLGSYYEATVLGKISRSNEYVVEYKTLLEDDLSGPLRGVVVADEVRPAPQPHDPSTIRFFLGDEVDAFDNDGWWVGEICGMNLEADTYYVNFPLFMVGIVYHVSKLRVHQDWKNGKWSVSCKY